MILTTWFWLSGNLLAAGMADEHVSDVKILLLGPLVIAFGAVVWAAFIRKAKRRRRRSHRPHTWELDPKARHGRHHSGGRRGSRQKQPPMNPTLAEAGGLPPVRPDESPELSDSHS